MVVLAAGVGGRDEAVEEVACPEQGRRVSVADNAVGGGHRGTPRGAISGADPGMSMGAASPARLPR
jgi:hypothetical protein